MTRAVSVSTFDADRAISYLADDAIATMSGAMSGTPEEFRLELSLMRAIGYEHTINDCEPQGHSGSELLFRCGFDFQALRSDELALGPYADNYWDLTIRDGTIVSAWSTWAYTTNGFSEEMWGPFSRWVAAKHPDDVSVMYTDAGQTEWRLSGESIRLWEQRTREYVAASKPSG